MVKCQFDKNGSCHALACYSSKECNSRDEDNNPMYATIEEINNAEKQERR